MVDYFYVKPGRKLKGGVVGDDYFIGNENVMQYYHQTGAAVVAAIAAALTGVADNTTDAQCDRANAPFDGKAAVASAAANVPFDGEAVVAAAAALTGVVDTTTDAQCDRANAPFDGEAVAAAAAIFAYIISQAAEEKSLNEAASADYVPSEADSCIRADNHTKYFSAPSSSAAAAVAAASSLAADAEYLPLVVHPTATSRSTKMSLVSIDDGWVNMDMIRSMGGVPERHLNCCLTCKVCNDHCGQSTGGYSRGWLPDKKLIDRYYVAQDWYETEFIMGFVFCQFMTHTLANHCILLTIKCCQ
jgi:hypothetical protein